MTIAIALPAKIDVAAATALRAEWLANVSSQSEVGMDCAALESFSAAGAQLIVSLAAMLKLAGGSVRLKNVSPSLREDLMLLGLPEYIEE